MRKPVRAYRWAAVAALAVLGPAGSIAAEAWTPFFMLREGVAYVDRNSVEHDGDHVNLATELWFETPPDLRGMKLNYVRSRVRLACADRTFVIVSQRFYGMEGQVLVDNQAPSGPRSPKAGAFESALLSTYCQNRPAAPGP